MALGGRLRGMWRGTALGACYTVFFVLLWRLSLDQWYLPAGLRLAALLATPKRYWLFLFAGEFAAFVYIRGSTFVPLYGTEWFVFASSLLMPATGIAAHIIRKYSNIPNMKQATDMAWLLGGSLASSITTNSISIVCLMMFAAPYAQHSAESSAIIADINSQCHKLGIFILGDYLGILMIAPLVPLWYKRKLIFPMLGKLRWDAVKTAPVYIALIVLALHARSPGLREFAHYLAFLPVLWPLTVRHGWRGAVIGSTAANLAIAVTMRDSDAFGSVDPDVLLPQALLAIFSTVFLGLGAVISYHYYNLRSREAGEIKALEREQHALDLARQSDEDAERERIEVAARAAKGHADWQRRIRSVIDQWRRKDPNVAMQLTNAVLNESHLFDSEVIDPLYPLSLEREGLYSTIQSGPLYKRLSESGINCTYALKGNPFLLSANLQRILHRLTREAVILLVASQPSHIHLRARCGRWGAAITIERRGNNGPRTPVEIAQLATLHGRVKQVYGGIMHNTMNRISILLYDSPTPSDTPTLESKRRIGLAR